MLLSLGPLKRLGRSAAASAFLFLALFLFIGPTGQAQAWASVVPTVDSSPSSVVQSVNLFCSPYNKALGKQQQAASDLLPVDRWSSATTNLHTDLGGGFFGLGSLAQKIQRNGIETGALAAGNTLWQAGTDVTSAATNFCFANSLGQTMNAYSVTIGNAFLSSGIVALFVAIMILVFLWRMAKRSSSPAKYALRSGIVLVVFVAMIAGASSSGGSTGGFGVLSPGWIVSTLYSSISDVASLPTMALAKAADNGLTGYQTKSPNLLSCTDYTDQLLRNYQADYGTGSGALAAGAVPMALNAMWEQTGLRAYEDIQFGMQEPAGQISGTAVNHYGLRVYCRVLEGTAGTSPQHQWAITNAGAGDKAPAQNYGSAAWLDGLSNSVTDASTIAWAACEYNGSKWSVAAGFKILSGGHKVTIPNCQAWWGSPAGSWSEGPFHWSTSSSAITNYAANSPAVQDFISNWHGDANGTAIVTAIIFLPTSFAIFGVFLVLAGALIIAKMALLILIMLAPVVLVLSLVPGPRWEGTALKLAKYALGLVIFGVGAQIILALVAIITGALVQAGSGLFGPGSIMTILWTGLAPFAAIWLMHHLFKMIGAPSPFKLDGALGWAAAAGGVGAGIGEVLHHRTVGRATQNAKVFGKGAAQSASRFVTRPPVRTGGLSPSSKSPGAPGPRAGAPGTGTPTGPRAGAPGTGTPTGAPGSEDGWRDPLLAASVAGGGAAAWATGRDVAGEGPGATSGTSSAADAGAPGPQENGAASDQARDAGTAPTAQGAAGAGQNASASAADGGTNAGPTWAGLASVAGAGAVDGTVADEAWSRQSAAPDGWSTGLPVDNAPGGSDGTSTGDAAAVGADGAGPTQDDNGAWETTPQEEVFAPEDGEADQVASQVASVAAPLTVASLTAADFIAGNEDVMAERMYRESLVGPRPVTGKLRDRAVYSGKAQMAVAKAAVKDRLNESRARFSAAPVRSSFRMAAKAGVVGAAVLATPVAAPVTAGAVVGVMAARHARRAHLEYPARKAFAHGRRVEAWRASQREQADQQRKMEREQADQQRQAEREREAQRRRQEREDDWRRHQEANRSEWERRQEAMRQQRGPSPSSQDRPAPARPNPGRPRSEPAARAPAAQPSPSDRPTTTEQPPTQAGTPVPAAVPGPQQSSNPDPATSPPAPSRPVAPQPIIAPGTAGDGALSTGPGPGQPQLTVLPNGVREWRRSDGKLHRDGGPAVEMPSGHQLWFRDGKLQMVRTAKWQPPANVRRRVPEDQSSSTAKP